jgi:hypothetical protein
MTFVKEFLSSNISEVYKRRKQYIEVWQDKILSIETTFLWKQNMCNELIYQVGRYF